MTDCPDCGGKLGASALKCRCGWSAVNLAGSTASARKLPCELTEMCEGVATVSVMIERKRVNGCLQCYHAHNAKVLREFSSKKSTEERHANQERVRKLLGMGGMRK